MSKRINTNNARTTRTNLLATTGLAALMLAALAVHPAHAAMTVTPTGSVTVTSNTATTATTNTDGTNASSLDRIQLWDNGISINASVTGGTITGNGLALEETGGAAASITVTSTKSITSSSGIGLLLLGNGGAISFTDTSSVIARPCSHRSAFGCDHADHVLKHQWRSRRCGQHLRGRWHHAGDDQWRNDRGFRRLCRHRFVGNRSRRTQCREHQRHDWVHQFHGHCAQSDGHRVQFDHEQQNHRRCGDGSEPGHHDCHEYRNLDDHQQCGRCYQWGSHPYARVVHTCPVPIGPGDSLDGGRHGRGQDHQRRYIDRRHLSVQQRIRSPIREPGTSRTTAIPATTPLRSARAA